MSHHFRLVVLESPFAGDVLANLEFGRACVRDAIMRGESPIASHLLYTQERVLRDDVPSERRKGIEAGLAWLRVADASVVYVDRGVSRGMIEGIRRAHRLNKPVEIRLLTRPDTAVSCPRYMLPVDFKGTLSFYVDPDLPTVGENPPPKRGDN